MNLNDKGAKKVYEVEARRAGVVKDWYEDIDFEPEDFDDAVVLTRDQAIDFLSFISIFHCSNDGKPLAQDKDLKALWSVVYDQLKQIDQEKGYIPINASFMEGK